MGNDAKRTPTPWRLRGLQEMGRTIDRSFWTDDGEWIDLASAGNAPFVLRACNAHDALEKLAEDIRDWLTNAPIDYSNGNVDPSGCFDEGDVLGWRYHEELKAQCAAAIALATEVTP